MIRYDVKISVFAGGRDSSADMLKLLVLLEAGRYIFSEVFVFSLVIGSEVVEIYFASFEIEIVFAGFDVIGWRFVFLELTNQHIIIFLY